MFSKQQALSLFPWTGRGTGNVKMHLGITGSLCHLSVIISGLSLWRKRTRLWRVKCHRVSSAATLYTGLPFSQCWTCITLIIWLAKGGGVSGKQLSIPHLTFINNLRTCTVNCGTWTCRFFKTLQFHSRGFSSSWCHRPPFEMAALLLSLTCFSLEYNRSCLYLSHNR